jgi:hypothetical protein
MVATATSTTPSDNVLTGQPSLTSESDSRVYYEDGNADVDYLTPTPQSDPIHYAAQIFRPGGGREPIVAPTNAQFLG